MRQITRTTNPTDLKRLDRKHFTIRAQSDKATRTFWIERFDHSAAGVEPSLQMTCVAHAGTTEAYFRLGVVSNFNRQSLDIRELATDRPLKFRFAFYKQGDPKLQAYVDGIRPADESGQLGGSLVDIEPADLNGVAWTLVLPDSMQDSGSRPNVLVERSLFPSAGAAANNPWFGIFVMPEVMRQIARAIAAAPAALDDAESWASTWAQFLANLGADELQADAEDDKEAQALWVEDVVRKFAAKGVFKHHMDRAILELDGESK